MYLKFFNSGFLVYTVVFNLFLIYTTLTIDKLDYGTPKGGSKAKKNCQ